MRCKFLPILLLAAALSPFGSTAQQPVQGRTLLSSNPKGRFMLGGGAGMHIAVSDRQTKGMWIGPVGGLSLSWQMAPRWSLQAEVRRREVRGYDFRVEYRVSGINAVGQKWFYRYDAHGSRLLFTDFPLAVKCARTDGRSSWLVGFRPALVNAPGGTHDSGYANVNGVSFSYYNPEYKTGFRRWDVALTLGFEFRLWRDFWLDARLSQGFLDLTHDNYFRNTVTDLSSDAQLTLRCGLLWF